MSKFNQFINFTKVGSDEERIVEGYISSKNLDNQNQVVKSEAIENALPDYLKWSNLRAMHQPVAAGKVLFVKAVDDDSDKRWYVRANVVDDDSWKKVKAGVYQGFSIGGSTMPGGVEIGKADDGTPYQILTKIKLAEISLVDRPANPDAVITLWKGTGINKDVSKKEDKDAATEEQEQEQEQAATELAKNDAAQELSKSEAGGEVGEGKPKTKPRARAKAKSTEGVAAQIEKAAKAAPDPQNVVMQLQALRNSYELDNNQEAAAMISQAIASVMSATTDEEEADEEEQEEGAEDTASAGGNEDGSEAMPHGSLVAMADQISDLAKSGRTLSSLNMSKVQAIHDHATAMGANCSTGDSEPLPAPDGHLKGVGKGSGKDGVKLPGTVPAAMRESNQLNNSDDAADIQKSSGSGLEPVQSLDIEAMFTKAVMPQLEKFASSVKEGLEALSGRLNNLESQPQSGGPVLNGAGAAITKSITGQQAVEPLSPIDAEILAVKKAMDNAPTEVVRSGLQSQLVRLEIRKAQSQPETTSWGRLG